MSIEIIPVQGRSLRTAFIRLPWKLYRHDSRWVPPLLRDEHAAFDKTRNPFFRESEADFLLARVDGRFVGRIAAIKYQRHLDAFADRTAFFGFFECIDDREVAGALFEAAGNWAAERGLTRVIGPYNFTFDDGGGLLIDGFGDPPTYKMNYNHSYYSRLVESAGFGKMLDLYTYDCELPESDISTLEKIAARALRRSQIRIDSANLDQFDRDVADCYEVYQAAFAGSIGTVDLSLEKFREMADALREYCDPELFYIARQNDRAVGMGVAIPDLNPMIRKWNGRVFPRGLISLALGSHRRLKRVRFTLIASHPDFQRLGVDAAILQRGVADSRRKGYLRAEASWIQESNLLIQKPLERIGFRRAKTYRVYEKEVGVPLAG